MITLTVNGRKHVVHANGDTPLLYVLRNELDVMTPKFGCGLAQCGACSVLLDGEEVRSCITPIAAVGHKEVTTVDGLPARWSRQQGHAHGDTHAEPGHPLHPVQEAWIEEQVPQCGICQFGMMIKVTELLEHNPSPTDAQIKEALTTSGPSPHLCRCGSYAAILDGVHKAARLMAARHATSSGTTTGTGGGAT
jgi:isoquinoline 1-oxidoreductase subunit alpha